MEAEPAYGPFRISLATTTIEGITLFQDRAQMVRSAPLTELKEGENEIILAHVPSGVQEDSFLARISTQLESVGARVQEVNLRFQSFKVVDGNDKERKDAEARRDRLRQELVAKEKELVGVEDQHARYNEQRVLVHRWIEGLMAPVGPPPIAPPPPTAPMAPYQTDSTQMFELLARSDAKKCELDASIREGEQKIQQLKLEISELRSQLGEPHGSTRQPVRPPNQAPRHVVRVREAVVKVFSESKWEAPDAATEGITLELKYVQRGASWLPTYHIDVDSSDGKVLLQYFAKISQTTGEDWMEAPLSLSTGMPSLGGSIPELAPVVVDLELPPRPMPQKMLKAAARAVPMACAALDNEPMDYCEPESFRAMDSAPAAAFGFGGGQVRGMAVVEGSTAATYQVGQRANIKSDGQPHKVLIASLNLHSTTSYTIVPSKSTTAYLSAKIMNDSEYTLRPGPLLVFVDGNLVTHSHLNTTINPGEDFEQPVGADSGVKVEVRRPTKKNSERWGMLMTNKSNSQHNAKEFVVRNLKAHEVVVSLKDQVPLSETDKVKVVIIQPSEKELQAVSGTEGSSLRLDVDQDCPSTTIEADSRIITWKRKLPPNEILTLILEYQIEYPKDKALHFFSR
mmetsp:Transcript_3997/g.14216  ORF Transcript_3997/g.14216 Transcript_3997/m.14216 type:complete len:626 (-) Transcript_3997:2732-4609(-)